MPAAIRDRGLFAAAAEPAPTTQPDSNPKAAKPDWERHIEQVEDRQKLTVIILLGAVLLLLAIWWSWGKIIHRRRRL
jgi:hypothetical protein